MGKTTHRPRNGEKVSISETPVTAVDARAGIAVPILMHVVVYRSTCLVSRSYWNKSNVVINARICTATSRGHSGMRRRHGVADLQPASRDYKVSRVYKLKDLVGAYAVPVGGLPAPQGECKTVSVLPGVY